MFLINVVKCNVIKSVIIYHDNLLIWILSFCLIKGSFCLFTESRDGKFFSLQDVEVRWSDEGRKAAAEATHPPFCFFLLFFF